MDRLFAFKTISIHDRRSTMEVIFSAFVISILLALSLLLFQPTNNKAKLTGVFNIFDTLRKEVIVYYGFHGKMPNTQDLPIVQGYINDENDYFNFSHVEINNGAITFTLKDDIFGTKSKKLSFRPAYQKQNKFNSLLWVCGYQKSISSTYTDTENLTSIKKEYLTSNCSGES